MEEEWKEVVAYEGLYQVSNLGRIKSLFKKHKNEIFLKPKIERNGYLRITLAKKGKHKSFSIHRLVAIAFKPNPLNLPQVNHIDENKLNNNSNNLEWCTGEYNLNYGKRNLKCSNFNKENFSKKVYQYSKDKILIRKWNSLADAERESNFNHSAISNCCLGKRKYYKNYKWAYKPLEEAN
jgi:hypothetical protein